MNKLQQKWDSHYAEADYGELQPSQALLDNSHLIPKTGFALDLACGFGASALYLARRGLTTTAWDLSPVAIDALQNRATAEGLALNAAVRDLSVEPLPADAFDLIYVGNFLERSLCADIERALRPGGVLVYQTWVVAKMTDEGPSNPVFLLAENELLRLFSNLSVRYFRDEMSLGDLDQGNRNQSVLIAQNKGKSPVKER